MERVILFFVLALASVKESRKPVFCFLIEEINHEPVNSTAEQRSVLRRHEVRMLDMEQVYRIDERLDSLGDDGELHLIVQHGELKYINKVESYRASRNTGHSGRSV